MIHNLAAYLRSKDAALIIVEGAFTANSPDESLILIANGGPVSHHVNRTDFAVQILSRYNSLTQAEREINKAFALLKNFFNVALPAVTIDGTLHPALTAWQISPMQSPSYLGTDANGRHLYSVNFIVTV